MGSALATGTGPGGGARHRDGAPSSGASRICSRRAQETETPLQRRLKKVSATLLFLCVGVVARGRGAGPGPRSGAARGLHVGGLAGGRRRSRGVAGDRHHRAGDRRPADGRAERAGPQAAGGGDARLRDRHLHRQDRHAHHRGDGRARALGRGPPRACWRPRRPAATRSSAPMAAPAPAIRPRSRSCAAAAERGILQDQIEATNPRVAVNPFDSERKRMSIQRADGILYVKGAVEVISQRAAAGADGASDGRDARWRRAGCGSWPSRSGRDRRRNGCGCVGLIGIADPPRSEAIEAIAAARRAGIRTVMITGDHPTTAAGDRPRARPPRRRATCRRRWFTRARRPRTS